LRLLSPSLRIAPTNGLNHFVFESVLSLNTYCCLASQRPFLCHFSLGFATDRRSVSSRLSQ
jgi:hypothetical protein